MNDISIKVLDALYDLCEDDGYRIFETEEITSKFPNHDFGADELAEMFESFAADGLVDLKYADTHELCISLRTKGRTLIKQSRERLAEMMGSDAASYRREEEPLPREQHYADAGVQPDVGYVLQNDGAVISDNIYSAPDVEPAQSTGEPERPQAVDAQSKKAPDAKKQESPKPRQSVPRQSAQRQSVQREHGAGKESANGKDKATLQDEPQERVRVTVQPNLAKGYREGAGVGQANIGYNQLKRVLRRAFFGAFFGSATGTCIVLIVIYIVKRLCS